MRFGREFVLGALFGLALSNGSVVHAQAVVAYTAGADTFTTPGLWGVHFAGGPGFVQSVSFDLSVDTDAFFDFDGSSGYWDAVHPVLSGLDGILWVDITFSYSAFVGGSPSHPSLLTLNFAPGSFGPGDTLRFGADTDLFVSDPAPGGVFGTAHVPFSVVMENGAAGTAPFQNVDTLTSFACVYIPEPASLMMLALGGGLTLPGKRHRHRA